MTGENLQAFWCRECGRYFVRELAAWQVMVQYGGLEYHTVHANGVSADVTWCSGDVILLSERGKAVVAAFLVGGERRSTTCRRPLKERP